MLSFLKRPSVALLVVLSGCTGVVSETPSPSQTTDGFRSPTVIRAAGSVPVRPPDRESANSNDPDEATEDSDGEVCPGTDTEPLANGLEISEIALYQTVKVRLYKDATWVDSRLAPIVQGKKALVRVFVKKLPGYEEHPVRGVLTLQNGDSRASFKEELTITDDSTDESLESTFTFKVDGARIRKDTQFSVALHELDCEAQLGDGEGTRLPPTGRRALGAEVIGKLHVVVVPVRTNGRVPVTSNTEVANIRSTLLAYYPVPDVEITVRDPLNWPDPVNPLDSKSWSDLLNGIVRARKEDAPARDVYYFGLVQPAANFQTYCARGCILGLAPQVTNVQASAQAGLGASFPDTALQTYETIAHELGHAHGRGHTACVAAGGNIEGKDETYPHEGGVIGTWGWDSRKNELMDPELYKDIMGYCDPNWISAYNYKAIAERSTSVNISSTTQGLTQALTRSSTETRWHHVLLYADGTSRWGGSIEDTMPGGTAEMAQVLDAAGRAIAQVEVVRVPLSHAPDQFLYIPEPGPSWAALQLKDRRLTLGDIAPAR